MADLFRFTTSFARIMVVTVIPRFGFAAARARTDVLKADLFRFSTSFARITVVAIFSVGSPSLFAPVLGFAGLAVGATSSLAIGAPSDPVLRIAAATDLRFALDELKTSIRVPIPASRIEIIYGTSGQLAQQIEAGAPYDLFFSADAIFAKKIEQAHLNSGAPFRYGTGRLVLWTRNDSKVNWKTDKGLSLLVDSSIKKIAVANPGHAPYGGLAELALKNAELFDILKPKLVTAEGVSQAAQFASTGATSVGLISESLALSKKMADQGHFVKVDEKLAPPLNAMGVVLLHAKNQKGAAAFRDLIVSDAGQNVLKAYGLSLKE